MDSREVNRQWYESFSEKTMKFTLNYPNDDGSFEDIEIPAKFEVCSVCDGKGSHVNPSIDSNGLSREDFDDDPDFEEAYFSGAYDVPCNCCKGNRVEPVVNFEALTPELRLKIQNFIDSFYEYQRIEAHERKMGY
jgi:hypothetical protein